MAQPAIANPQQVENIECPCCVPAPASQEKYTAVEKTILVFNSLRLVGVALGIGGTIGLAENQRAIDNLKDHPDYWDQREYNSYEAAGLVLYLALLFQTAMQYFITGKMRTPNKWAQKRGWSICLCVFESIEVLGLVWISTAGNFTWRDDVCEYTYWGFSASDYYGCSNCDDPWGRCDELCDYTDKVDTLCGNAHSSSIVLWVAMALVVPSNIVISGLMCSTFCPAQQQNTPQQPTVVYVMGAQPQPIQPVSIQPVQSVQYVTQPNVQYVSQPSSAIQMSAIPTQPQPIVQPAHFGQPTMINEAEVRDVPIQPVVIVSNVNPSEE